MAQSGFESPFMNHLESNFIPSRFDRQQIEAILEQPEAQLSQLNQDVADIQARLDAMVRERNDLQQLISEHYNLLAPMRSLPDDMLREIFLHCLPTEHNAVMSGNSAPLLLGRVCSRWRTVLYRTPRAWASLHVPIPSTPSQVITPYPNHLQQDINAKFEDKVQRHCTFIREWLARSGGCPLSLSFHPKESGSSSHCNYVRTYLNVLLDFLPRWGHIETTIPLGFISKTLAKLKPTELPMLTSVDLRFMRRTPHDTDWPNSGILQAKSLRCLRLSHFPTRVASLDIDWSRLTHLIMADSSNFARLRKFTVQEAYSILTQCKQLEKCSLDILASSETYFEFSSISLPHLESLSIIDGNELLTLLFECLEVPALRHVTYHTTLYPSERRRTSLIPLLSRTHGSVRSLTIDCSFFTLADFLECLQLVPSLTTFVQKRSRFGVSREQSRLRTYLPLALMDVVVKLLTPSMEDECYCRKLEELSVRDGVNMEDNTILDFIHGRMGPGAAGDIARLKHVAVSFLREQGEDVRPQLETYVQDGFQHELTYLSPRRPTPTTFNPWNGVNRWGV